MNLRKLSASISVIAILILSMLSILSTPVRAAPQSADISSAISGQAQWFTYDSANNRAWISVGVSLSNLYKVDLANVIAQGTGAVTGYTNLLGNACGGSLADGPAAGVMLNGYLWVTAWYSTNCIGVSKIDSSGTVLNTYTYSGPTDARAITTDGTSLIVGTQTKVLKMTQTGDFTSLGSTSGSVHDLRITGSTVYFTMGNSKALGKVDLDGSNFQEFNCGVCSTGNLMDKDNSGNFWFSDNVAHKLVKFDGVAFTVYNTGFTSDGPYGVCATSTGMWMDGYANLKTSFFPTSTLVVDSTLDITTSKKPFQCFKDSSNNVWNIALGSAEITKIPESSASPSVTATTTATATVTSVSGASTVTTTTTTTVIPISSSTTSSGFGGLASYVPQVIPTIVINSTGLGGEHNIYLTRNGSVTLTGFLSLPVSTVGTFDCLTTNSFGLCVPSPPSPSPSSGTFRSFQWTTPPTIEGPQPACTIVPYLSFCHLAYAPVNSIQTSSTKFGIFCNNAYIVNIASQCNGNGIPVSYQTFKITVSNLPLGMSVISLQAIGSAEPSWMVAEGSGTVNLFVWNIST